MNLRHTEKQRDRNLPEAFAGHIDRQTYLRSIDYTKTKQRFGIITRTLSALVLLAAVLSGALGWWDRLLLGLSMPPRFHGIVYIFSLSLISSLLSLPASAYAQFKIENRFGFNNMKAGLFFTDFIKSLAVSAALMFGLLYVLFLLPDIGGRFWWILALGAVALFQLLMTVLYPLVIAPLFNKFTPLEEGELRDRLFRLAEKLDFAAKDIFVMDGSRRSGHSNAFFTGLGRVKRIVLYDTLLQQLEASGIEAVLAHEIGHEKKKHTLKMYLVSTVLLALGLFAADLLLNFPPLFRAFGFQHTGLYALVLIIGLCLSPLGFYVRPLLSMWSRKFEYQADAFAVSAVGSGAPLAAGLITLSKKNLSNPRPHPLYSFFYYSHPPLLERLERMRQVDHPSR